MDRLRRRKLRPTETVAAEHGGPRLLQTLEQAGVGAIGLQNVATPFSFRDPATNEELGTLQSTGVFLREDGGAGTVRQIDVSA